MEQAEDLQRPLIHSTCTNGGTRRNRRSSDSNSPEFEFWMLRNPSFPPPNLLSADELFSGGVLLPLHHLRLDDPPKPPPQPPLLSWSDQPEPEPEPELSSTDLANFSASNAFTSSNRWKEIFKKTDKKKSKSRNDGNAVDNNINEKNKEKKRGGARTNCGKNRVGTGELNVNLWPFSRSRSAGNNGTRQRLAAESAAAARKVSSAPCSRSNSAGESKTLRKWPSSPSRSGVHLGSSPVLHVRRGSNGGSGRSSDRRKVSTAESRGGGEKSGALNFNVPVCIGYRHHLSCGSDENSTLRVAAEATRGGGGRRLGGGSGKGVRGCRTFNIRSMFTKKVY